MMKSHVMVFGIVSAGALTLSACADEHRTYRLSSVGSKAAAQHSDPGSSDSSGSSSSGSGSSASSGGSGSSGNGNLVVASGNILIGAASKYAQLSSSLNGAVPASGVLNGTVTAVLAGSGQTLVRFGSGTSVLLNGTGGRLGDLVSIDLGRGRVIGGPQPLVGANVLALNPVTGRLATVSAASGNSLLGVTVLNPASGGANPIVLAPQVGSALGLQPGATLNGAVNATVNGVASGTASGAVSGLLVRN